MEHAKIARGGYSSVYSARHRVDQQLYAIKKTVLNLSSFHTETIKEELERMMKEVRVLASIKDPHVISYNHSWFEATKGTCSPPPEFDINPPDNLPEPVLVSPYIEFTGQIGDEEDSSGGKENPGEDIPENSFKDIEG